VNCNNEDSTPLRCYVIAGSVDPEVSKQNVAVTPLSLGTDESNKNHKHGRQVVTGVDLQTYTSTSPLVSVKVFHTPARHLTATRYTYFYRNHVESSVLLTKYYQTDQIKEEVGGACSTYGREQTCIRGFL
jgi:hypothetical protein